MAGIDPYTFYWGRMILSLLDFGICLAVAHKTNGEHGIGWFFVTLIVIWA